MIQVGDYVRIRNFVAAEGLWEGRGPEEFQVHFTARLYAAPMLLTIGRIGRVVRIEQERGWPEPIIDVVGQDNTVTGWSYRACDLDVVSPRDFTLQADRDAELHDTRYYPKREPA